MNIGCEYDVSLILSVHDDSRYLARTIWSFSDAASYAALEGITTELVIVQDNPAASIPLSLEQSDFGAFKSVKKISVSVGSLGPCRQAGVDAASGKYVALCDADDLISYNMISDMYKLAERKNDKTVIFPEWLMAFGSSYHLYKMFSLFEVNEMSLFDHHPFISRSFLRRDYAQEIRFADVPARGAYAYEDWHHNTNLAAHGFDLIVCPNTIFFYRKKGMSLLQTVNSTSVKAIPYSDYFKPANYLRTCRTAYHDYRARLRNSFVAADELYRYFSSSALLTEFCAAANFVDPAVDVRYLHSAVTLSNKKADIAAGAAYYRICEELGENLYSDVFLLPFFTIGGAEKVIINIIEDLLKVDPSRKILLIFGMKFAKHHWLDRLPQQVTTCDISHLCGNAPDETIDLVALRTIQTFAPNSRVFIKSSPFGYRFWGKYNKILSDHEAVLLRFCDGAFVVNMVPFTIGFDFNFLSEYGDTLSLSLSDNQYILNADLARLPFLSGKQKVLYSSTLIATNKEEVKERCSTLHRRIVWASRIDHQKRPELLPLIANALNDVFPEVKLEVWGTAVLQGEDISSLEDMPNVILKGTFASFEDIPYRQSDAFIYTSRFDGIPTVLLSALAAGMPVIAPRLGGIPEVIINGETGILVDPYLPDADLVTAYIDAIRKLFDNSDLRLKLGLSALELIQDQHSPNTHLGTIRDVFG
ncbi:glycosyltransferase [Brucella pseudogrignonensis]|uniref:glycosyltransferase n=1 Tax=Brucella pseudogrignonensis TaxID=419475 RepID=UPI00124C9324|nr:glycosyltransferase [Brucella pseudogrignonensis]KAB2685057.1 glycosyltransferase [Brucella pseudogrignonensis]